jgi:Zn finger protein HypA/HybF involved in hydrogenase expression
MADSFFSLENLLRSQDAEKPSKKNAAENAKTLETYHQNYIQKLNDDKINISDYKKELAEKKEQLYAVEREFLAPNFASTTSDIKVLTSRQILENEIIELEEKIQKITNGEHELDYFLRVGNILFSYADAKERIAAGEAPVIDTTMKKGRIPANSVYSYFSSNSDEPSIETAAIPESKKVDTLLVNDIGFKRDKALEQYLNALNPDSTQNEIAIASSITEDFGTCPICDTEMFLNETYLDCPDCGFRDMILVDSEKPSYKDPPREMSYYAYKKINHLNEWLAQFQAKETTEISQAVLDQIRAELRKERITDMSKLKPSKLKEIIKKLKLNRCYDHVAHILNRLNGISAPVLSREVEEKLRFMFREIQFSFVKHCPKKRSNFLSYSYVLYKFCELLELDDYLPCFPLLKSREKLYMQDKIWQKICEDMNWEFIRTV